MNSSLGVGLALGAAVIWAIGPLFTAAAARRLGPLPTMLWRTTFVTPALLLCVGLTGAAWPAPDAWLPLVLSGVLGITAGDLLITVAFVELGPRRTVQLLTLGPCFAFLLALVVLGEVVAPRPLAGAALVLAAGALAVWTEHRGGTGAVEPGRMTARGFWAAASGAALGAAGTVLMRAAYRADPGLHPVAATTVRVGSAAVGLWLIPVARGEGRRMLAALRDRPAILRVGLATVTGPFLGMLAYVGSLRYLGAGLVTTLVSLSAVFILPISIVRHRARVGLPAVAAALLAVGGVALISK